MRTRSKKLLALLMALAMVMTMLPLGAFTATADEARDHYLFAYFTGNSTEQQRIKFALSEDGNTYYAINKNDPVIKQTLGTGCARDPYVFRGQDGKFYAIATDMDASGGWWGNSNSFVLWRSNDLITWTNETIIDISALTGVDVYRAWAPQVMWDASEGKYMVYFGLAANGYSAGGTKMHYMYTSDLLDQSAYSAPQPMMANNAVNARDSIDGDITYYNGTYYMFYKDESQGGICIVTSSTAQGLYNTDNIVKLEAGSSIGALEGCQVWWDADSRQYILMADRYSANGVFACYNIGDDLDAFYAAVSANNDISGYYNSTMSSSISVLGPRHGSILNITETEYNALKNAYGIATNEDVRYNFNSQNYVAENSWHYDAITDTSGYTYDVMTNGGQYSYSYTDEHFISLNGSTMFINDPVVESMMADTKWTVSFDASIMETRGAPLFALTSGDAPASSIDWIRLTDNGRFYLYKNGAYAEIGSTTITTSVEYTFTITYDGTNIILYKDGSKICEDAIGDIQFDNTKSTSYAAFGWTDTCGVTGVHGAFTNVRFRNKTLTASQVASETAIQSELLYQYNEGTDEINGRINATAGGDAGVTTSMTGARGASYTVAGWFNIGGSKEGSLFSLGWGGTDASKQYLNLREDGVINYCWGDGSTQHFYDSSSIYNFANNTWYYVQINIVPEGNSVHFRSFVNGASVNDQTTGYNDMTTHEYNPHAFFLQNTIAVRLGTSNVGWWNAASNTNFDDFRVYTKAIDPAVLYAKQQQQDAAERVDDTEEEVNASTLAEAIAIYESRIARMASSGYSVMYTNLSAAYTAYKRAVKAPGTPDEGEALAALNLALTNMKVFIPATANATPGEEDTNYNPEAAYYGNVIYAEGGNSDGLHGYDSKISAEIYEKHGIAARYGSWAYLYYPATVLLYDGVTTPKVPVMVGFRNNDNRYAVEVLQVGMDTTEFALNDYWTGYTDSTSFTWPTAGDDQFRSDDLYAEAKGNGMWTPSDGNTTTYRTVKNALAYIDEPTSAYTCFSSTTWNIRSAYTYLNDHYINDTITNAVPDIDVINYKKLTDALKTAANNATNMGYLADLVEKYQNGGLEGIFAAYDSATSLDPNTGCTYFNHTYDYNGEGDEAMDAAALLCGKDIDASVALLGAIKITTESANYDRLCEAIKAYEAKMKAMTTPYTNLEAAYEAYVLAVEYKDAYEYGAREIFTNPTLAIAAQNLEEATANMKSLNEITFKGTAYFVGAIADSEAMAAGNNDTAGFNNILYCSTSHRWTDERDWNSAYNRYGMPSIVVLIVDGNNTPSFPVAFTHRKKSGNYGIYYVRNATDDFELRSYWKGYNNYNSHYHYNTSGYDGTAAGYEENYLYATSSRSGMTHNNTSTARQFVNKWFYTGTGGSTSNGSLTDYYNTYNNMQLALATTRNNNYNSPWINNNSVNAEKLGTVYTINYKALKDAIANLPAFKNGIDVKNYVEGGLKTDTNNFKDWLAKIDAVTGVDPNSFFNNMNDGQVPGKVTECATAIKNACAAATGLSTTPPAAQNTNTKGDIYNAETGKLNPIDTTNKGAYTNLKIAILEAQDDIQGCVTNTYWSQYQTALANAQAAMANIADPNTENYTDKQGYNSSSYSASDINNLATALHDAHTGLFDLTNASHPLKFSYQEKGRTAQDVPFSTLWFQCYRDNSHILDVETHKTITDMDGTAYDEAGQMYKTLDLTKFTDKTDVLDGKAAYDAIKTEPGAPGETAQKIVDDGVQALLEGINIANEKTQEASGEEAVVKKYNVTFKVVKNDDEAHPVYENTTAYNYGTVASLDASAYVGDATCERWTVNGNYYLNQKNTMNVYVQKDTEVIAYFAAADDGQEDFVEVRLGSVKKKTHFQISATTASTIQIQDGDNVNTILVDGKSYTVPNTIVYKINSWNVGNTALAAGTYTVAELMKEGDTFLKIDPSVSPNYTDASDVFTITVDGQVTQSNIKYDTKTDIKTTYQPQDGEEVYGMAVYDGHRFIPISYETKYHLFVIRDMDVFTIIKKKNNHYYVNDKDTKVDLPEEERTNTELTDETMLFYLNHKLPMMMSFDNPDPDYKVGEDKYSRYVLNGAFTTGLGSDVKIMEVGFLYSSASGINEEKLTLENVGNYGVAKKEINGYDQLSYQYYYALKSSKDATLTSRAYVKYTYDFKGETVSAVAYSDTMVSYYNNAERPNA